MTSIPLESVPPVTRVGAPLERVPCPLCAATRSEPLLASRAQMTHAADEYTLVRCAACGLVYLNPRVPLAEAGFLYDDSYPPHRGSEAWGVFAPLVDFAQQRTDRARVRLALAAMSLGPAHTALDVGCGRPTFLRELHRATGAHCAGVDPSAAGWSRDPSAWTGLDLTPGVVADLPATFRFDLATLWHVLEHEYEPRQLLSQLRTRARAGARLIVEVPNFDSLTRRLQGSSWAGFDTPRHTAAYTPATLRDLIERAGWTVERSFGWGTLDPYLLWWLGRQAKRGADFSGSLAPRFPGYVLGKAITLPIALLQRVVSLGNQIAVARC